MHRHGRQMPGFGEMTNAPGNGSWRGRGIYRGGIENPLPLLPGVCPWGRPK